jgi:two-component system OmpR family response regulator/two-component system response regulator QseB
VRALLVEDDEMIGRSLMHALDRAGWSVDWVRDGALAHSAMVDGGYTCVLLDLGLPQQDGTEVLRRARASAAMPRRCWCSRRATESTTASIRWTSAVLTAREFALLHALLERPGAILSREQLEERIYGWGEEVTSNAIDVLIHGMRRKLGAEAIRNVRGLGWRVVPA